MVYAASNYGVNTDFWTKQDERARAREYVETVVITLE